jgi:hypothetical protein
MLIDLLAKVQATVHHVEPTHELDIPDFLKISPEDRRAAWVEWEKTHTLNSAAR